MNRKLAKELKVADFPMQPYRLGHRFYPHETRGEWSRTARAQGVTITPYELQAHSQDIRDGYYCPQLADLIEACGGRFERLFVEKNIWTAETTEPGKIHALADSPEEAVAKLWFALHQKKS
jgi:hypothetical protein